MSENVTHPPVNTKLYLDCATARYSPARLMRPSSAKGRLIVVLTQRRYCAYLEWDESTVRAKTAGVPQH